MTRSHPVPATPRPALRFDRPSEWPEIRRLLDQVFGGVRESSLVAALRGGDDLMFLIVAVAVDAAKQERIIGVVGFSKLPIDGARPIQAAALAPLAVAADMRGRGVGSALVGAGVAQARKRGAQAVCVLGHARFFQRLGFDVDAARKVRSPWSGPNFLARALDDTAPDLAGEARYPPAFGVFDSGETPNRLEER